MVANGIIVLDVRADRYIRLGTVAAGVFLSLSIGEPLSNAQMLVARHLATAGLLLENISGRPVAALSLVVPTESALERGAFDRASKPGTSRCAMAVVAAKLRLKFAGLACTLEAVRRGKARSQLAIANDRAETIGRAFDARRSAIPIARSCLPDSLAIFTLLIEARIDATLVIGVRDCPFAAHCWVQTDRFVLTDAAAPIQELTPIMAI